jgi:hypothetical protein
VNNVITGGLNRFTEWLLIKLLSRVRQPWSARFFEAIAQIIPVIGYEAVILREVDGRLQALMTRRPDDDKVSAWAGLWHVPGTIVRGTDKSKADVFARLTAREIGAALTNFRVVYDIFQPDGGRKLNLQLVHAVDIVDGQEPTNGTWFNIVELPESIPGHHEIIFEVAAFLRAEALGLSTRES